MDVWMWIAAALSLIATVGVAHKKSWGQLMWIVSNAIWVVCYIDLRIWPSVALFAGYLLIASKAYCRWRREEKLIQPSVVDSNPDHLP